MKGLSQKEAKFRIKFIAEHHYDKEEQHIFDEAVKSQFKSYTQIYKSVRSGNIFVFMTIIESSRMSKRFKEIGISAAQAAESLSNFNNIMEELRVK